MRRSRAGCPARRLRRSPRTRPGRRRPRRATCSSPTRRRRHSRRARARDRRARRPGRRPRDGGPRSARSRGQVYGRASTVSAMHPDDAEWDAWRPETVAARLEDVDAPWAVAAGWAIDLFLGYERREHEDLEVAVPAVRFAEIEAALPDLELHVVGPATAVPVSEAGSLVETHHQTWALDPGANVWRLDVFREPSDDDTWICRRDETLRMPYDQLIERTGDG